MLRVRTTLVILLVGGLGTGCAFGTRNVNLIYEQPPPTAAEGSRGTIAVARFTDTRTAEMAVGSQVGQVRNGFGAPTANVEATQSPVLWVGNSLARGLTANGFRVEKVDQPNTAGGLPVVTGSVSQVFVDMYMGMEGEVKADVSVEQNGKKLFSTQCEGKDSGVAWTGSADEFQTRLTGAMKQLVETCVPKLMPYLESKG